MESVTEDLANQIAQMQQMAGNEEGPQQDNEELKMITSNETEKTTQIKQSTMTPLIGTASSQKPKTPNPKKVISKPDKKPYIIGVSPTNRSRLDNFLDLWRTQ